MRALVTGATGFVGSHLVASLVRAGASVAVISRRGPNRADVETIPGDLATIESSRARIEAFAPDVTFHLGWGGVGREGRDDRIQIDANLLGTIGLFDIVASLGCRAFVGLGSQAEYGPSAEVLTEQSPLAPTTLYGASKASCALILDRLATRASMRFAWLRLFTAYGPGDHEGALIPSLIRSLLAAQSPRLTTGRQPWDFLFVEDAADAIRLVGASETASGVFNLASGRETTVRAAAEMLGGLIDPRIPLGFGLIPEPESGVNGLRADVSRLRRAIDWEPRVPLREGLIRTVESARGRGFGLAS